MHIPPAHPVAVSRRLFVVLLLVTMALPSAWPQTKPANADSRLSAALQSFVDSHSLAGAVALVANKDKMLAVESVGFADIVAREPMTPDALFWIASQFKSMTAAALMMLVRDGRVFAHHFTSGAPRGVEGRFNGEVETVKTERKQ